MKLFDLAKTELLRSNADRRHPFCYFCMATINQYPEVRMVVKRKTNLDLSTVFFTDARSPKMDQIRANQNVSALFYHSKKKLQVRINGKAAILENGGDEFSQFLHQVKQSATVKDYTTTQSPGSVVGDESEILFGKEVHFAAIKIVPLHIDVLLLGETKHTRSSYSWRGGEWKEAKLVP